MHWVWYIMQFDAVCLSDSSMRAVEVSCQFEQGRYRLLLYHKEGDI